MISIFTTVTNPVERGDLVNQAIRNYCDLADEVIVIDGGSLLDWLPINCQVKVISSHWPQEFKWEHIGRQFQKGYEACTEDWVIHADLDFIFHENDFNAIRQACEQFNDQPAFSMLKRQFILPDRFNLKSRLVVAVNKGEYGDRIRFDSGGDLCQPSLDKKYIQPGTIPDVKIPIWNYEKLLKTKAQIAEDQGRMERAWHRSFGKYQMGSDGTNSGAFKRWYEAQMGKLQKPHEFAKLSDHPKVMQDTIKNLTPEQFGYNAFGAVELNEYTKGNQC